MAHAVPLEAVQMEMQSQPSAVLLRTIVIGLTAFLTVVDLFATQAILPTLTRAYQVTPAAMGFAVNSSTMGMAVAGLVVSLFSQRINRRLGILVSLSVLSVPTALLAVAPDLTTFRECWRRSSAGLLPRRTRVTDRLPAREPVSPRPPSAASVSNRSCRRK